LKLVIVLSFISQGIALSVVRGEERPEEGTRGSA
jgi:hypothetical protein